MRCYAAFRVASAGTNLLPAGSLYAVANQPLYVYEVAVFNTTTTATDVALRRLTTAGTPGAAQDELGEDPTYLVKGTAFGTHTSTGPTITAGNIKNGVLGAAAGSGIIWTFGSRGIEIPAGTANGLGLTVPNAAGQIWNCEWTWEE